MYVSRSFILGLVVFAVVLMVSTVIEKSRPRDVVQVSPASYEPVTVVDIARGVDVESLTSLVRLRAGERVVTVDDHAIASDLAAGAAIAARAPSAGDYVDLTVVGPGGSRRVLVLLH